MNAHLRLVDMSDLHSLPSVFPQPLVEENTTQATQNVSLKGKQKRKLDSEPQENATQLQLKRPRTQQQMTPLLPSNNIVAVMQVSGGLLSYSQPSGSNVVGQGHCTLILPSDEFREALRKQLRQLVNFFDDTKLGCKAIQLWIRNGGLVDTLEGMQRYTGLIGGELFPPILKHFDSCEESFANYTHIAIFQVLSALLVIYGNISKIPGLVAISHDGELFVAMTAADRQRVINDLEHLSTSGLCIPTPQHGIDKFDLSFFHPRNTVLLSTFPRHRLQHANTAGVVTHNPIMPLISVMPPKSLSVRTTTGYNPSNQIPHVSTRVVHGLATRIVTPPEGSTQHKPDGSLTEFARAMGQRKVPSEYNQPRGDAQPIQFAVPLTYNRQAMQSTQHWPFAPLGFSQSGANSIAADSRQTVVNRGLHLMPTQPFQHTRLMPYLRGSTAFLQHGMIPRPPTLMQNCHPGLNLPKTQNSGYVNTRPARPEQLPSQFVPEFIQHGMSPFQLPGHGPVAHAAWAESNQSVAFKGTLPQQFMDWPIQQGQSAAWSNTTTSSLHFRLDVSQEQRISGHCDQKTMQTTRREPPKDIVEHLDDLQESVSQPNTSREADLEDPHADIDSMYGDEALYYDTTPLPSSDLANSEDSSVGVDVFPSLTELDTDSNISSHSQSKSGKLEARRTDDLQRAMGEQFEAQSVPDEVATQETTDNSNVQALHDESISPFHNEHELPINNEDHDSPTSENLGDPLASRSEEQSSARDLPDDPFWRMIYLESIDIGLSLTPPAQESLELELILSQTDNLF
ncbi:hypothetical protein BDZ97DRAFT_1915175 [Flammula alnicola]|nr:hypothetical protein BDZ97DRAFT_1915175 [Flammula alnicola]